MIHEENQIKIEKTEGLLEETFGIDPNNISHILGILRDKMYSDKPLAVIREYATNAYDAHIEAGISDKPIEISLPNDLNPMLCIRDFGKGMSPQEIKQTYIQYGSSTKRKTNTQSGFLGIGSKSGFSYTDTFNVISYHNGYKNEYCCYIDETKCGKIALLDTTETEETGIEIRIPIKKYDWNTFRAKIENSLCYMNPLPLVDGKELQGKEIDYELDLKDNSKIIFPNTYRSTYIIMGGIPYSINYEKIYNLDYWEFKKQYPKQFELRQKHPSLIVPIGAIDIVPSREGVEYTEKTINFIKNIFDSAPEKIEEDISNKISIAKTFKEARELYVNNNTYLPNSNGVIYKNEIINSIVFHDHFVIDEKVEGTEKKDGIEIVHYNCSIYGKAHNKFSFRGSIQCYKNQDNNFKFIEIDIPYQWKSKINKWWETDEANDYNQSNTVFVNFGDQNCKQKFFNKYHLEEYEWIKLSDLTIPKTERTSRRNTRTTHLGQIFIYKYENKYKQNGDETSTKSEIWQKITDDKEVDNSRQRYYVVLDRFRPVGFNYATLNQYIEIIKQEKNKDILFSDIIGIKEKYKEKIESHWINLEETAKELLDKYKEDFDILATFNQQDLNFNLNKSTINKNLIKNKNSSFYKYLEYQEIYEKKKKIIKNIIGTGYKYNCRKFGWSWLYPDTKEDLLEELKILRQEFIKTYQLLINKVLSTYNYEITEHEILYVNLIDEYNKKQEREKK